MIDSLHIAATGMSAQQSTIDTIANNLANLNTPGFKKSRVQFEDLMYGSVLRSAGPIGDPGASLPIGMGTALSAARKVFTVGDVQSTGSTMDFAIRGDGFFEVALPDGTFAYTRTGSFHVDSNRSLVTSDGHPLSPPIDIPLDTEEVVLEPDGAVLGRVAGEPDLVPLGRLELSLFVNPGGLEPMGDNLYRPTHESGDALYVAPGEEGSGLVAQGFLESSNVDMVEELTQLMLAQRAYEVNSRVIQASDELLAIVNSLRR